MMHNSMENMTTHNTTRNIFLDYHGSSNVV